MKQIIAFLLIISMTTACGTMSKERAISGAGLGAAAGTIIGAVTGMSLLQGAALGAAGGALTGVLTDSDDMNFGTPAWKRNRESNSTPVTSTRIARIQSELNRHGYNVGSVDGVLGRKTRESIIAYQQKHDLLADGQATAELLVHLQQQ